MNQLQKDKYRMNVQGLTYDIYQRFVVRYRMRFVYLDRIDHNNLWTDTLIKQSKLLDDCDKLGQERSI